MKEEENEVNQKKGRDYERRRKKLNQLRRKETMKEIENERKKERERERV